MTSRVWHVEATSVAACLRAAAFAFFIAASSGGAIASGKHVALPAPTDLALEGMQAATQGKPLVILFSLPGCHFCDVVRQNYLLPLVRDLPAGQRPVIREVQISGSATFAGFNGERTSHHAFAMRYKVRFAPTVVFLDSAGNQLTHPIIGGDTSGLYGGTLDNAFAEASRKLIDGRRAESSGE